MTERLTLHFVDGDSRSRAEFARMAYALGHHAEVYSDLDELEERPPREGIIIARDDQLPVIRLLDGERRALTGAQILLERLEKAGIWLPLVAASEQVGIGKAVEAMRAGAFDYLPLPVEQLQLHDSLRRMAPAVGQYCDMRRRLIDARQRIASLSTREREVLDWLAIGNSNKAIARALDISPRTVEIHRANMMEKLGAKHSVEAVRLWLEAELEAPELLEVA